MEFTKGKIKSAKRVVLYGSEGIGKSTFASKFPNPVFIDLEDGTRNIDVVRTPKPNSWEEFMKILNELKKENFKTIVVDTLDRAEDLAESFVCRSYGKESIERFQYGKGWVYVSEKFNEMLALMDDLVEQGINIVLLAHAITRKFELPDEDGSFDKYELNLSKRNCPIVREWSDMLLFANYKIILVNDSNGKKHAKGGERVMYTTHHPAWEAKNRYFLDDMLPFDYGEIADIIADSGEGKTKEEITKEKAIKKIDALMDTDDVEEITTYKNKDAQFIAEKLLENGLTVEMFEDFCSKQTKSYVGKSIDEYDPDFLADTAQHIDKVITTVRDYDLPF